MDAIEQFIVGKDDAVTTIWSSLSPDICDAKLIAVVDQPGVCIVVVYCCNKGMMTQVFHIDPCQ